jgi:hypothetical protein
MQAINHATSLHAFRCSKARYKIETASGSVPKASLLKHRHSTSLRFPFAYLANKRRKVALSPVIVNHPSSQFIETDWEYWQAQNCTVRSEPDADMSDNRGGCCVYPYIDAT